MKNLLILLFILFLTSIAGICSENNEDSSWKRVSDNNYIDSDGIVGTEDMYGFSFLLKSYNKGQYEPVNGKNVWYTLSQYTIDCGHKTYKIGVMDSYGYKNNFINGDYNKYAQFQPIVQGTAVSAVANKLCRE